MPSSHILDTRLQLLTSFSPDLFADKRVLDIGSNQGNIPVDIALHFSPRSVTGIEADPGLVNKSKSHLSFRWSRLGPGGEVDWFPASSVLSHGHVPYPPYPSASDSSSGSEGKGKGKQGEEEEAPRWKFPHNVTFECRDFVADALASREKGYGTEKEFDVVLMLSVVKWLHLEGGDDGICFPPFGYGIS
jgi:7SK snRNA methylphosphate capping enzyme